jgi:hypothetical protein
MKTVEIINDLIDLTEWKTKKQINEELKQFGVQINERVFRLQVERHNEMYFAHIKDDYVAHSSKGYKLTKDRDEIAKSIEDTKKRGLDQLVKYHKCLKALGENSNFNFRFENGELIYDE